MITIRADMKAKNKAVFAAIKDKLNAAKDKAYRQRVFYLFKEMLKVSYQFSGDFTSNWRIITQSGEIPPYNPWPEKATMFGDIHGAHGIGGQYHPHQAGDPEAINFAFTRAKFVQFGAKDRVYFVNSTPLEFTGTTVTGPDGETRALRPENVINGGERIQTYIKNLAEGNY